MLVAAAAAAVAAARSQLNVRFHGSFLNVHLRDVLT